MMTGHFHFQYLSQKVPVFQMWRKNWIVIMIIRQMYIIIDPEHIIMQNMYIFAIVYCAVSLLFRLAQAIVLHCKFQDS